MAPVTRRSFLRSAAVLGITVPHLHALTALASIPDRPPTPGPRWPLPDVQFAINDYIAPAQTLQGVTVRFPPVYTSFTILTLTRTSTKADQGKLGRALETVEQTYPYRPDGVFTYVGYGLLYFTRLPGGMSGPLMSRCLPRLASDPTRYALEEAVPGPTDVGGNPGAPA